MFEKFNLPEMDDEMLSFTEQFVNDMREWTHRADTSTGGEDAQTVAGMRIECEQMLLRIRAEQKHRLQTAAALKIQAAVRGFQVRQEIQRKKEEEAAIKIQALTRGFLTRRRFETLKQQANNYAALEQGLGGAEMQIPREKMLAKLREKLMRQLGTQAPLAFQLYRGPQKVQELLNYLIGWEKATPEEIGFKSLLRNLRKGISHQLALNQALAAPTKIEVTNADLSMAGRCTAAISKTNTYRGFYIPNTMRCTLVQGNRSFVIDVQGFGASKPPMTKHLEEYLDSYNGAANVFDAIAYCRSWILDLSSIPYATMKLNAGLPAKGKSKGREAARLYGPSQLRWEFLLKVPGDYDGTNADFVCYHVVPKGLQTGINHFAT
ncbi:MAG: hypothetical protein JST06_08280 [Bacteroidetes bacterium]|nr:hypothetical protein [Bacteroidota bacterium]MBS1628475.1 hypothetical protein [Bacteroidota bacterium]